ncbi:conserved hypothetical protein [uncultured Mycobacterium sp.]|uniref:4Fe-4S Wbl-type domain-containing protein n=1 Tax=uncultured Mycobacterium sp. TaxID=171292 RepID=A0A1Y5PII3_9MYCO|nr:conserved hypothetical protein [uncultured Mycobacterium sp.]
MRNALCRGRAELFDSEDPADAAEAVALCQLCPELDACRAWVDRLDKRARPPGTTAGRVYRPRRRELQPAGHAGGNLP